MPCTTWTTFDNSIVPCLAAVIPGFLIDTESEMLSLPADKAAQVGYFKVTQPQVL